MEYTGAVRVGLLEIIEESTHRYEVQVSALDLAVMDMDEWVQDLERRLVNLGGVEGVAQEAWQMAAVAQDATENIQATRDRVSNLEGQMEDVEVVAMEVDEQFSEAENKIVIVLFFTLIFCLFSQPCHPHTRSLLLYFSCDHCFLPCFCVIILLFDPRFSQILMIQRLYLLSYSSFTLPHMTN